MKVFRSYWGDDAKESDIRDFTIETVYGNLTSGSSTEAAVTVSYNLGGSGEFTGVFVYTLRAGRPTLIGRIEGGDRAHGAIKSVRIQGGTLFVERYQPNEDDCLACYGYTEVTAYEWLGEMKP